MHSIKFTGAISQGLGYKATCRADSSNANTGQVQLVTPTAQALVGLLTACGALSVGFLRCCCSLQALSLHPHVRQMKAVSANALLVLLLCWVSCRCAWGQGAARRT